jgi:hypothetical protein
MKTVIITLITIVSLATASRAADAFNSHEFSVSLFGNWVDKDDSDVAPGAGLTYYFTKHIGLGAFTHWDNYDGTFIDNVSTEAHLRVPLGEIPLAPYGLAALGYSFETEEVFEALGGGLEWRFNEKWGAFGDVRWQFNNDTDDGVAVRAGVRLVF